MLLGGEIALVTGASRGIGAAIAAELGRCGATVIGTATSAEGAERIAGMLRQQTLLGSGMVMDVNDGASIQDVMTQTATRYGIPSILVNNAGITRDKLLLRMQDADWDAILATNLSSVYRLSKACLPGMIKARKGRIINIGSVVGMTGNIGQCNYAAAKAGLIGFSHALSREVAGRGITVNTVAPGFIDTDMTRALPEQQKAALISQIPLNRLGMASEVAYAVAFLASASAAYITGHTLHINGGMFMA